MPTWKNICRAVYGAWRLLLLDSRGIDWFELSITGFLQSFFASLLVAPFYLAVVFIDPGASYSQVDPYTNLLAKGFAYILSWISFPIVMVFICRIFSLTETYIPYIIALNWSAIIQTLIFFPVMALGASKLLAPNAIEPLILVVIIGLLFYQWFIARCILKVSTLGGVVLVLLDLLIKIFIAQTSDNLLILSVS